MGEVVPECTCPVEHTVAKLGHCRTCDAADVARRAEREMDEHKSRIAAAYLAAEDVAVFSCGGRCMATPSGVHNFNWATYSDDFASYGVCACGLTQVDVAMMSGEP